MAGRENTFPDRGWAVLPAWTPDDKIQAGLIRPYNAALTNALLERVTSITSSHDGTRLTPPAVAAELHIQQIDDDGYEEEDSDHVPGIFFNLNTGMAFLADHEADHFMVIDFNNWSVRPVHKTFCRVKWASGNTAGMSMICASRSLGSRGLGFSFVTCLWGCACGGRIILRITCTSGLRAIESGLETVYYRRLGDTEGEGSISDAYWNGGCSQGQMEQVVGTSSVVRLAIVGSVVADCLVSMSFTARSYLGFRLQWRQCLVNGESAAVYPSRKPLVLSSSITLTSFSGVSM
jgi:hypothetical protein